MKKRLNITFFGICFLAALLAETYCLTALKGDLISSIGFGIVVLITGYLLLDSIISTLKQNMDNVKFYTDRILREETERWNERYTELANLQKATYTATKKNTIMLSEHLKEILIKYEALENDNRKELQRIIDLQKKSMEGQKNALNMEIHYNRENTKQLMEVLHTQDNSEDYTRKLSDIIGLLEENKKLLSSGIVTLDVFKQIQNLDQKKDTIDQTNDFNINDYQMDEDIIEEDSNKEDINDENIEENIEVNIDDDKEGNRELNNEDYISAEESMEKDLTDSYLTEQDIARLDFPEQSNDEITTTEQNKDEIASTEQRNNEITTTEQSNNEIAATEQAAGESGFLNQAMIDQMLGNIGITEEVVSNPIVKEDDTKMPEDLSEFDNKEYQPEDFDVELSSPELPDKEEEPMEEVFNMQEPEEAKTITPLYSDPNKALTADEIAALFASFGQ